MVQEIILPAPDGRGWDRHWMAIERWWASLSWLDLAEVALNGAMVRFAGSQQVLRDDDLRQLAVPPDDEDDMAFGVHRRAALEMAMTINRGGLVGPDWTAWFIPGRHGSDHHVVYDAVVSGSVSSRRVVARILCADYVPDGGAVEEWGLYSPSLLVAVDSDADGRPNAVMRLIVWPAPGRPDLHPYARSLFAALARRVRREVGIAALLVWEPTGKLRLDQFAEFHSHGLDVVDPRAIADVMAFLESG